MAQAKSQSQSQAQRLSQLRALAQSHLTEIETEKSQEEIQFIQSKAENQRYLKISSSDRKKLASQTQSELERQQQQQQHPPTSTSTPQDTSAMDVDQTPRKQRLRPFPEILHRLQWDPKLNINEYSVGYVERFEGIKEMPASSWVRDFSDEEWIPMHRVRYVKRVRRANRGGVEDEGPEMGTVWDRDGRIDKFARSSGEDGMVSNEDILSMDGMSVTGGVSL